MAGSPENVEAMIAFRYFLFYGDWYYPSGGWDDFSGSYADAEGAIIEAKRRAAETSFVWWHVVDSYTGKMVARGTE